MIRKGLKFLAVLAVILLASAVLAPLLFKILPFKFEKIFNRLVMIQTLAAVLVFVRFRRGMFGDYGLRWTDASLSGFLAAFETSVVVLTAYVGCLIGSGYAALRLHDLSALQWILKIANALLAAVVVGVLEEFFFRGFIYQSLRKSFAGKSGTGLSLRPVIWAAVGCTSLFYSLLHFTSSEKPLIGPEPTVFDSFRLMAAPFASYTHWENLWPAVAGLFIFGVVLNALVLRTGSLYPAIGLHAGCVFFIKLDGAFADFFNKSTLLFGSSKLYDGVAGWGVLILVGVLIGNS
ncbi:MAG: CPBP family intramembrane glutamic endopeptidase, partial [Candidatus Omnitrophota bacterium]